MKDALLWRVGDILTEPELAFSVRWSLPEAPQVDRGDKQRDKEETGIRALGMGSRGGGNRKARVSLLLEGRAASQSQRNSFLQGS